MNLTLEQELARRQRGAVSEPQQAVTAPTSALESRIGAASGALARTVPPAGRPTPSLPVQPPRIPLEEEIAAAYLALSRSGQQPQTPQERDRLARALAFRQRLRETTAGAEPTAPVRQPELAGRGGLATAITGVGRIPELFTRPLVTPEQVERLPSVLRPVGRAARELTSPAQIALLAATAGAGPAAEAAIGSSVAQRVATQAAVGTGAILAGQEVAKRIPENAPLAVRLGLPLAAGLVAGGGVIAAGRALGPALRQGAAEALVRTPVRTAQETGVRLASHGRGGLPQGAAVWLPAEVTSARIKKFLSPALEAANASAKKRVEALGLEYDALAGTRPDEFFLAVEVPKRWSVYNEPAVAARAAGGLPEGIEQSLVAGRTLYFKDFPALDDFLQTGHYAPASIVSPVRQGAIKPLYQAGKLPTKALDVRETAPHIRESRYFESTARVYDEGTPEIQKAIVQAAGLDPERATSQFAKLGDTERFQVKRVLDKQDEGFQALVLKAKDDAHIADLEQQRKDVLNEVADQKQQIAFLERERPYSLRVRLNERDYKTVRRGRGPAQVSVTRKAQTAIDNAFREATGKPFGMITDNFLSIDGTSNELQVLGDALRRAGYDPQVSSALGPQFARDMLSRIQTRARGIEQQLVLARGVAAPVTPLAPPTARVTEPVAEPMAPVQEPVIPATGAPPQAPARTAAKRVRRATPPAPEVSGPGVLVRPSDFPLARIPQPELIRAPVSSLGGQRIQMLQPPAPKALPPARAIPLPGEIPPAGRVPSAGADIPPYVAPSPVAGNVIGLRPIQSGLSRADELANIAKRTVSKVGIQTVEANPLVSGAFRERARAKSVVASQSQRLGTVYGEIIPRVFQPDKDGRIAALAGIDSKVPGAPTIQDVAARLPNYWAELSGEQRSALLALRRDVNPYRALLGEVGVEVPSRPDVMEGGFYLPRGRADLEGADAPLKVFATGGVRGGKKGFERPAVFESQAAGIKAGYAYAPIGDTLTAYGRDAGNRAVDAHITNFFKAATDEEGSLLGSTQKARLLQQNRAVADRWESLQRDVASFRGLVSRRTAKLDDAIDRFFSSPEFEDIQDVLNELDLAPVPDIQEGRAVLKKLQTDIKAFAPQYRIALRRAMATPRLEGVIGLPGLQGVTFPDEIANAANTILKTEGRSAGPAAAAMDVVNAFNNLYRGMRATLDNSALGIQGLLGAADNPVAYGKAVGVNIRAWGPGGEKALGRFIVQFDAEARAAGRLSSDDWARAGLRIGGAQTEFQLGQGISAAVGRIPLIRGANRAFGYFGDALRLNWADEMLRTAPDGRASAERIAHIANNMTGWTEGKTFGSMGDLLLFAPRFLQARLETTVQGVAGLRPGASIEQAAARRSLLKMMGYATVLTVAANEMLGNETDFRPLVKGKWNPNFLRIRYAGRDWTILGTWDSLARAVTLTAGGHPEGALRGLGSGVLTSAWDLISGRTFAGKPVRDNVQDFSLWIMRQFLPFSTEEVPATILAGAETVAQGEAGKAVGAALTTAGMLVGGKSSPLSHQERLVERVVKQYGPAAQTVVDGLDRLGVTIARVNTKFDMRSGVKGGEIDLTSAQRDSLQELTEDTVIRGLRDTFASSGFQKWTPERQKEYVKSQVTALREQARSKFRASLQRTAPPAQGAPPAQNLLLERLSRGIRTP